VGGGWGGGGTSFSCHRKNNLMKKENENHHNRGMDGQSVLKGGAGRRITIRQSGEELPRRAAGIAQPPEAKAVRSNRKYQVRISSENPLIKA